MSDSHWDPIGCQARRSQTEQTEQEVEQLGGREERGWRKSAWSSREAEGMGEKQNESSSGDELFGNVG